MTPPLEPDKGRDATGQVAPPAVLLCVLETLRNRPDFLKAASALRQGTAGFLVQARARGDDDPVVRVGFTASKKIGNAVFRNRAKRRMRALVREILPGMARTGWDYVLVARPDVTVSRDFAEMKRDLAEALVALHLGKRK